MRYGRKSNKNLVHFVYCQHNTFESARKSVREQNCKTSDINECVRTFKYVCITLHEFFFATSFFFLNVVIGSTKSRNPIQFIHLCSGKTFIRDLFFNPSSAKALKSNYFKMLMCQQLVKIILVQPQCTELQVFRMQYFIFSVSHMWNCCM